MGVLDGSFKAHEQVLISATQTSGTAAFTEEVNKVMVLNRDASNPVYVELGGVLAAVATSIRIGPNRELVFPVECLNVAAICDTGETATVQFVGLR